MGRQSYHRIILAKRKKNPNGYTSCLPVLMDFPLQGYHAQEPERGQERQCLQPALRNFQDSPNPTTSVVFPDNHDMSRWYTQVNEAGFFLLGRLVLTTRASHRSTTAPKCSWQTRNDQPRYHPQRLPGGWTGDKVNVFTKGLTEKQQQATIS